MAISISWEGGTMSWAPLHSRRQGQAARPYQRVSWVPRERLAVIVGGLSGGDRAAILAGNRQVPLADITAALAGAWTTQGARSFLMDLKQHPASVRFLVRAGQVSSPAP
jgi:hypothetical protein